LVPTDTACGSWWGSGGVEELQEVPGVGLVHVDAGDDVGVVQAQVLLAVLASQSDSTGVT
jgi:hypothetical protein